MGVEKKNRPFRVVRLEPIPHPVKMLWSDFRKPVHAEHHTDVSELRQFCEEERPKSPPELQL